MNFARCRCFFESNIYLKDFGLHVLFKSEQQFAQTYGKVLHEKGCADLEPVIDKVKHEVRRRKNSVYDSMERESFIKQNYKPLHLDLFTLQENFIHPDFLEIHSCLERGQLAQARSLIKTHKMDDLDVYSFPLISSEFCQKLVAEINHFNESDMPKGKPNSMNNYGVLLNELGLYDKMLTPLKDLYIHPLCQYLFPQESNSGFDSYKAFTVDYESGKDTSLDFHFDNAEVTLNVCLTADCEGGELFFENSDGSRGFGYLHQEGRAVLHRGSALHCVLPLQSGRRVNLVAWLRNSSIRNELCPMCKKTPDLEIVDKGWGDGFTILG